jgi:hypothetical protein
MFERRAAGVRLSAASSVHGREDLDVEQSSRSSVDALKQ